MTWKEIIKEQESREYYKNLQLFLDQEYQNKTIFPKRDEIFRALDLCSFLDVKVVILGQDPYPGRDKKTGITIWERKK